MHCIAGKKTLRPQNLDLIVNCKLRNWVFEGYIVLSRCQGYLVLSRPACCVLPVDRRRTRSNYDTVVSPSERRVGGVEVKTNFLVSCYRLGRWAWAVENGPWSLGGLISLNGDGRWAGATYVGLPGCRGRMIFLLGSSTVKI